MRMAESVEKKETIMREKDLRGAQVWMGAEVLIRSLIVWRLSGRKISLSLRFVMRRVLEGGVGCTRGGRLERSRERDLWELRREEMVLPIGEVGVDILGSL